MNSYTPNTALLVWMAFAALSFIASGVLLWKLIKANEWNERLRQKLTDSYAWNDGTLAELEAAQSECTGLAIECEREKENSKRILIAKVVAFAKVQSSPLADQFNNSSRS